MISSFEDIFEEKLVATGMLSHNYEQQVVWPPGAPARVQ